MAGKDGRTKDQRFKLDLANWKRDIQDSAAISCYICISISLIAILLWNVASANSVSTQINLTLCGFHLGSAMHSRLCFWYHSYENIKRRHELAWRETLLHIDADRIANGLKPLSEIFEEGV